MVDVLQAMMPEEDPVLGGNLLDPLHDQLGEVGEVTIACSKSKFRCCINFTLGGVEYDIHIFIYRRHLIKDLPLASRHVSGIDVLGFERREEQLGWACRVGVRPGEEHGHIEILEYLHGGSARVVRRVVNNEDCAAVPVLVLLGELLDQGIEEYAHH